MQPHGTDRDRSTRAIVTDEAEAVCGGVSRGCVCYTWSASWALVLAQYPLSNYVNADEALAAIQTDSTFACPARLADQALSNFVPVFAYEFNDQDAPEIFLPPVIYP
jgi:hypothetical protein